MKRSVVNWILLLALGISFIMPVLSLAQEGENVRLRRSLPSYNQPARTTGVPSLDIPKDFPVLEQTIDPKTYIIGPGDKFLIILPTHTEVGIQSMVTADGNLMIPTVGIFKVAELSLEQFQRKMDDVSRTKYREGRIKVNLLEPRYFRVHVLGEVFSPGIYPLRQTYRITDALQIAGGPTDWANLSAVEIRRKDRRITVDVTQYFSTGGLQYNPQVLDGDVIFIPKFDSDLPLVRVEGRIQNPGLYFAKPGEHATEFLTRIYGANRKNNLFAATIKRPIPGKSEYAVIPIFSDQKQSLANGHESDLVLQNGDIVSIPSLTDSVYVTGAVLYPGAYPYFPGFLAKDYAGLAGINERAAGAKGIRVRRADNSAIETGPSVPVRPGDTVEVQVATRIILKDYLQIAATVIGQVLTFLTVREALRK